MADNKYCKTGKDGKTELTDEGRKKISELIVENSCAVTSAFGIPQPLIGRRSTVQLPFLMQRNSPAQIRKDSSVSKPKVPAGGLTGFGEEGAPADWDLSIGEIYGYRWWKIKVPARFAGYMEAPDLPLSPATRLVGANDRSWETGRAEAVCTANLYYFPVPTWAELLDDKPVLEHEPPEVRVACGCGFWAYFNQASDVASHFSRLSSGKPSKRDDYVELPVFGVVKGSGRVVVGEKGFRAQYAEIVALCIPEVTQVQLSWWTAGAAQTDRSDIRRTTFYHAAMNGPGWYTTEKEAPARSENVSDSELAARLGTLESMLENLYPGVQIFSDRSSMVGCYPPDKNYG